MSEWATDEIEKLSADNARLRALIKAQEWGNNGDRYEPPECPWCQAEQTSMGRPRAHAPACPAFTPEGEVR